MADLGERDTAENAMCDALFLEYGFDPEEYPVTHEHVPARERVRYHAQSVTEELAANGWGLTPIDFT